MVNESRAWKPTATIATLRLRATMLARIRGFFAARNVLEVETPTIVAWPVSEPQLANVACRLAAHPGRSFYLRTSPESHLKRLLAAGGPDVFEIGKVFRDGEHGARHLPEFTMVEWYRRGLGLLDIVAETCALISDACDALGATVPSPQIFRYQELFEKHAGFDPLTAPTSLVIERARAVLADRVDGSLARALSDDREAWLDLLMTGSIEPALRPLGLVVIERYPAAQAALARLDPDDRRVAERFEVYLDGVELANGYCELTDPVEQRQRFEADRAVRRRRGLPDIGSDAMFLAALDAGLPECSGVALGFDRLLMAGLGLQTISAAVSFPVPDPP